MIYQSITDKGKERNHNEDNYSNYVSDNFALFVIADGLGGYKAGEVASKIGVEAVRDYISVNFNIDNPKKSLIDSIKFANKIIYEKAKSDPECANMGSTIVVALLVAETLYVGHLGDSRLYHLYDSKLHQITKDDSYVQKLIDTGAVNKDDESLNEIKNLVTKALGAEKDPEISINILEVSQGDYILLTTDGLTNMVEDHEIEEVINMELDIKESVEILTYMANSSGGLDNISLTLVKL